MNGRPTGWLAALALMALAIACSSGGPTDVEAELSEEKQAQLDYWQRFEFIYDDSAPLGYQCEILIRSMALRTSLSVT